MLTRRTYEYVRAYIQLGLSLPSTMASSVFATCIQTYLTVPHTARYYAGLSQ